MRDFFVRDDDTASHTGCHWRVCPEEVGALIGWEGRLSTGAVRPGRVASGTSTGPCAARSRGEDEVLG